MARISTRHSTGVKLVVRPASLRDVDTLVQQRRGMWKDLGVKDESRLNKADKTYERWARARMRNHQMAGWLVETRDKRVVGGGCLWLQPTNPNPNRATMVQPYLLSMYTEPEFRNHGVASMVVSQAVEWCRKKGYERLRLHASEMGRNVYKRLGFKRTWEMRLDLEKSPHRPGRRTPVTGRTPVVRN